MALGIILLFLVMWIPDLPGMLKQKQWPELAAFAALWAAGLTLALLLNYGVPVNAVTKALRAVFEPIGRGYIQLPAD